MERPAYTRILIDLASYVVRAVNEAADREPGSRLSLIKQRDLLQITQSYNHAKEIMDQMVQAGVVSGDSVRVAVRELERSTRLLIPGELKAPSRLILTHLGKAYRFCYLAQHDGRCLFKAIAAVEMLSILLDETVPKRHRATLFFDLGQMYDFSSRALGRVVCWRISLRYYQRAMELTSDDEDPNLLADVAWKAAWVALKLLRIRMAMSFFREARRVYRSRPK